jgi:hypothetical protein
LRAGHIGKEQVGRGMWKLKDIFYVVFLGVFIDDALFKKKNGRKEVCFRLIWYL